MIYDFNNPLQYLEAMKVIEDATENKSKLDIRKAKKMKTIPQNRYLYFLCRYFATEYGCTETEAKEIYLKRQACPSIFRSVKINKYGKEVETYRSISTLTIDEMSSAIRNFIDWAALGDIELPLPDDKPLIRHAQYQIEKNQGYI